MAKRIGKARYDGKKMYFDEIGWRMVKATAKKTKKSPTYVVTRALMLLAKRIKLEEIHTISLSEKRS